MGTASYVKHWIFLEQPGAWGHDALTQSRLPRPFADELRRRCREAGVRVVLIRRGSRFAADRRVCYFARTDGTNDYLSRMELTSIEDLLDVDLDPLVAGGAVDGSVEVSDALFLVCTHGRHDACCSIEGNQVSRVACAEPGRDAWECSHIGGDRFAANLVCFPHGVYYGRVKADLVAEIMRAYGDGTLWLDNYRGRCSQPFPVQAAECYLRRELDEPSLDAVALKSWTVVPEGVRARFAVRDGRTAEVDVAVGYSSERYLLTCKASRPHPIPSYELRSIEI